MKSSETGFLSNKPVYALIAIYMPILMLSVFVLFLNNLLNEIIAFNAIFPIVSGIITSFAASIYCDFMKDSKTSRTAANLRGAVLVLSVSYLISSLIFNMENSLTGIISPNLHNISSCIAALYAWESVFNEAAFQRKKIV